MNWDEHKSEPNEEEPLAQKVDWRMPPPQPAEQVSPSSGVASAPEAGVPPQLGWGLKWAFSWLPAVMFPFIVIVTSLVASAVVMLVGMVIMEGGQSFANQAEFTAALNSFLQRPLGFFLSAAPAHLIMMLWALGLAFFSREKLVPRLGLRRGAYSPLLWPVLMVSAPAFASGIDFLVRKLGLEPSPHLVELEATIIRQAEQNLWLVILVIAVLPGIAEELVFRGYVQDRLTKVWFPALGILFSSVVFAMAHLDPVHVALVFPLGLWLGVVAWRANSIWPAIGGHFLNNLFSVLITVPAIGSLVTGTTEWVLIGFFWITILISVAILGFAPRQEPTVPSWLERLRAEKPKLEY